MRCPFCNYRRIKKYCTPHWQCPKCEKAYNKFRPKILNKAVDYERPITDKERVQDFITSLFSTMKGIASVILTVLLLFFGLEDFLIEGVYYISNYYGYYKAALGNDLFVFSILTLFLLFIIVTVIFIGRKVLP